MPITDLPVELIQKILLLGWPEDNNEEQIKDLIDVADIFSWAVVGCPGLWDIKGDYSQLTVENCIRLGGDKPLSIELCLENSASLKKFRYILVEASKRIKALDITFSDEMRLLIFPLLSLDLPMLESLRLTSPVPDHVHDKQTDIALKADNLKKLRIARCHFHLPSLSRLSGVTHLMLEDLAESSLLPWHTLLGLVVSMPHLELLALYGALRCNSNLGDLDTSSSHDCVTLPALRTFGIRDRYEIVLVVLQHLRFSEDLTPVVDISCVPAPTERTMLSVFAAFFEVFKAHHETKDTFVSKMSMSYDLVLDGKGLPVPDTTDLRIRLFAQDKPFFSLAVEVVKDGSDVQGEAARFAFQLLDTIQAEPTFTLETDIPFNDRQVWDMVTHKLRTQTNIQDLTLDLGNPASGALLSYLLDREAPEPVDERDDAPVNLKGLHLSAVGVPDTKALQSALIGWGGPRAKILDLEDRSSTVQGDIEIVF